MTTKRNDPEVNRNAQESLRYRREKAGLRRTEVWVHADDIAVVRAFADELNKERRIELDQRKG